MYACKCDHTRGSEYRTAYRATLVLLMYFLVNLSRRETGAGLPDPSGPELCECELSDCEVG